VIPLKIEKWLARNYFPQRVLLSGDKNSWDIALNIASKLQKVSLEKIKNQTHFDSLVLADHDEKIKIGSLENPEKFTARGLKAWATQKPVAAYRLVLIENFERMTRESIQTCLKILEEPPAKTLFIFTTKNHHQLPATILSRMTIVRITGNETFFEISNEAKLFIKSKDLIEKFGIIQIITQQSKEQKSKKIITNFIEDLIKIAKTHPIYQPYLEILLESHQSLFKNINAKLTLERLALHLT
jgi:DNA polymerase III delta prime subunit